MSATRTVAIYRVKPGTEERNVELVEAVYRELAELAPAGFRYRTLRLDEGRTFVHIAEVDEGADGPLTGLASFGAFLEGLGERCEWGPTVKAGLEVGRYEPM